MNIEGEDSKTPGIDIYYFQTNRHNSCFLPLLNINKTILKLHELTFNRPLASLQQVYYIVFEKLGEGGSLIHIIFTSKKE